MFKYKHNKMFCMTFFFIAALSIVFLFAASDVSARPASSALHTLTQPDGYTFQARLWGDEYYHGWETEDGYTIILDESSKTWFYAVNDAEGNLVLSQYAVGQAGPPEGLKKYLRITGDALSRIQQRRMKRQPLSLDTLSLDTLAMEPMAPKDGSNNVLTLLMNFSDTTTTITRSQFEELYFKKGNNSITDYYLENSYGKLTVTSGPKGVQEWWTAKNTHNYYGADDPVNTNINDVELPKAVRDLVTYWNDTMKFNFAPYSQSGDCIVDTVAIVVQGKPQSSTGVVTDIWPKQAELDPPYETGSLCDGSPNVKVKIKKYTIQTELEGEGNMATIGTFAHEYGHALGLPDLYDTSSVSKGLGNWATMAAGCDNKNPVGGKTGDRPAHHDAWSKFFLGWIKPIQVTSALTNETIPPVEDASKVYQLLAGTPESGEYFLIENRQQKKFDIGLPGAGLLIWHIDGKVVKDNSILVNNKVNAMPCNNGTPCSVQHYGVALQQADGLWELEKNTNNGDAGDPYPGSTKNTSFTDNTSPDSRLYNNTTSDVSITNISASGENIIATLSVPTTASPYQWQWREPLPQGNTLESASFGKNLFVAVGGGGTIITSPDGITWTKRDSGTTGDLKNVFCTSAYCIAVGVGGIFRISIDDGITWNTVNTQNLEALYGVGVGGAGNDQMVVAGGTGTIIYTNSIYAAKPFTPATTPVAYNLYGITYGNKLFVAVGGSGTIITSDASPNASTWTKQTSGTESDLRSIILISIGGVNKFYAVGNGGVILTSSNGTAWTKQESGTTNDLTNINISNDTLIAVGSNGTILTSKDGAKWTTNASGTTNKLSGAAHGNNTFVVIGNSGAILTSSNGTAWTARSSGSTANISGAAYGNNTFVIAGAGGAILTSSDGAVWTARTSGTAVDLSRVGYGNSTFVAVGNLGTILTSSDGTTWTSRTSGAAWNTLYDVAYGNGTFVVVGDTGLGSTGIILTSPDGAAWTARDSKTDKALSGITYGSSTFVAVGAGGAIITSPDGTTWTTRTSGATVDLSRVAFGGNTFIAVGDNGTILTSTDGVTWTAQKSQTTVKLRSIIYTSNTFVAVGDAGTVLASSDGKAWSSRASGISRNFTGVATGNNTIIVAGDGGTVLQSNSFSTCSYTLSPTGKTFSTSAGADAISVTTSSTCTWTATVSVDASSWISVTSGSSGTGSGTVSYSVFQNTGASARKGVITAAGQTFRVAQEGTNEKVFLISLAAGWNLISLPLQPSNTATSSVTDDISSRFSIIWGDFNPSTQQWKYKNASGGGLLNTMESGKAYWVFIINSESTSLIASGSEVPHSITLQSGWNFVGFNKLTEKTIGDATNSISGKFSIIWGDFNPSTQQWKYKSKSGGGLLDTMNPAKGYWIFNETGSDVLWTIP